jgi:hypothetical protein
MTKMGWVDQVRVDADDNFTFRADMQAEEAFLAQQASTRGYADLDAMAERDTDAFVATAFGCGRESRAPKAEDCIACPSRILARSQRGWRTCSPRTRCNGQGVTALRKSPHPPGFPTYATPRANRTVTGSLSGSSALTRIGGSHRTTRERSPSRGPRQNECQ